MIASITAFASSVTDRSSIVSTEDYVTSCQGLKLVTLLTLKKRVCYIASLRAIANPIHKTNSLALHHQPLSTVILLFAGSRLSGIRVHNRTLQRSAVSSRCLHIPVDHIVLCSTDVDSPLAICLDSASIGCRYDHSLSSLRSSKAPP